MKTAPRLLVLALIAALAACSRSPAPDAANAPAATTAANPNADLIVNAWALPAPDGAAQPDLSVGPDGRLLVSWIRKLGDRNAFQYAAYLGDESWESAPKTIAVGRTMIATWADSPHIVMTEDRALWAHWLQAPADAKSPHASDIVLTRSPDNGVHWAPPVAVNDDATGTEHGFVSMWPAGQDAIGMAWLDGRKTAGAAHVHEAGMKDHAHEEGAAGEMTVRGARFDGGLQRSNDTEIDASTCDCCGTDAALTDTGPLLVYRDRSKDEIRDISATHLRVGKWDAPKPVHGDGWKMTGCPLNGPAVGAWGPAVAVAWYTAPNDKPVLRLARSKDSGNTFDAPIDVDSGPALQGRVDVAKDGDSTWLVWIREDKQGQSLQVARYPNQGGEPQEAELARLSGRGRATGFPKLAVRNGVAFVVWTDIVDGRPRLAGAKVAPRG